MFTKIIQAEAALEALLPATRLVQSPSAELRAAAIAWSETVWAKALEMGPAALNADELTMGHKLALHPVYVCGVHRSGTTLVRDLLDDHPQLVMLPSEGTFYTNLERKLATLAEHERAAYLATEWLRRLVDPINQPPYWLLGRTSTEQSPYVRFARNMMAWWNAADRSTTIWPHLAVVLAYAQSTGKLQAKYWADKTPTNERFLQRIWTDTSNAKVIHVIREPAATISSRQKMEPTVSLRRVLTEMKRSFRISIAQAALNNELFLLLRYEELCEDTPTKMDEVARFLTIQPSPVLQQPSVAGIPSQANSSFSPNAQAGHILKNEQRRESDALSQPNYQVLAAYLGKTAAKLGYHLKSPSPLYGLYLKLKNKLL